MSMHFRSRRDSIIINIDPVFMVPWNDHKMNRHRLFWDFWTKTVKLLVQPAFI